MADRPCSGGLTPETSAAVSSQAARDGVVYIHTVYDRQEKKVENQMTARLTYGGGGRWSVYIRILPLVIRRRSTELNVTPLTFRYSTRLSLSRSVANPWLLVISRLTDSTEERLVHNLWTPNRVVSRVGTSQGCTRRGRQRETSCMVVADFHERLFAGKPQKTVNSKRGSCWEGTWPDSSCYMISTHGCDEESQIETSSYTSLPRRPLPITDYIPLSHCLEATKRKSIFTDYVRL